MKHKVNSKFNVLIVCRVYLGAARFNTNTTAFKKSRGNISPINNQEYFDRDN